MAGQDTDTRERILDAALAHVPFDGWSDATLRAAAGDLGVDPGLARALFPRGAVDMALAYHARGDAEMLRRLRESDLSGLRFRDRVSTAVRYRIEAADRELVRRATALFALPQNAAAGARAIWGTADLIWTELGDTSQDANWYTKRATLSGVYSATLLYWLGDHSAGDAATWGFLDRRIEDVMRFEKVKSAVRGNPLLRPLIAGPEWLMRQVRAPAGRDTSDLPGRSGPPPAA